MLRKNSVNRRQFLLLSAAAGTAALAPWQSASADAAKPRLGTAAFSLLPLGAIEPTGWLRRQLQLQADGLSGHLDEVWADVGPNSAWLGGTGESWERGPYWMDGLVPLAYLLDDARLKAKVQPWMDWSLKSQGKDGNFGTRNKNNDWWPRMVMMKALVQYQEASGDPRVVSLLERYFDYQLKALPAQPLASWAKYRWQDNVLSVLWLYEQNGDPKLLELAQLLHDQGHNWRAEFDRFVFTRKTTREELVIAKKTGGYHETHGVDIAMGLKSAAIWSRISHDPMDRSSIAKMLAVLDQYHGLPNGMYSADEHLAGRTPIQGTELCTVVEVMFSLERAIAATGDASLADRLEKIAFNALPGAISDDMWSHQYDQEPNQIECTLRKRPWSNNGPEANLFGLKPNFGCCAANFHQGWPKLASSLWMRNADGDLVAIAYAPCTVNTKVQTTSVRLETMTDYPFRNVVNLRVQPETPVEFAIRLRAPQGIAPMVQVNGRSMPVQVDKGFVALKRQWIPGDSVRLEFPMQPHAVAGFAGSVSLERGPLVFSLPIKEYWTKLHDHGQTADWEVRGRSTWNYGLMNPAQLTVREYPVGDIPFGKNAPAVTIEANAVQIANWQAAEGVAGDFPGKPEVISAVEKITLVPYASTKLRITALPTVEHQRSA